MCQVSLDDSHNLESTVGVEWSTTDSRDFTVLFPNGKTNNDGTTRYWIIVL